ncbi:hypothetical protein L3V77_10570 [Vibrio sp. DW001]|uniref:hypothetical protein n=1 Tax=Vibrio sp. DW001 TaxID=2912315 RepID=UPI0023B0A480|nr:hypothetical protein [Vibrio sp. DW001]WED25510.1 hypothetical protein L3V77_10570 [Vibrio sp. DW001]
MINKDYYQQIGQILFNISPDSSKKIIMRAKLSKDSDVGTFEYDYENAQGETHWITGGGEVNTKLLQILVSLRKSYVERGEATWTTCTFTVDIEAGTFDMNLEYDV